MGKWQEPDPESVLLQKMIKLFNSVREKAGRDYYGVEEDLTLEKFIDAIDLKDNLTRQLFENFVKGTLRAANARRRLRMTSEYAASAGLPNLSALPRFGLDSNARPTLLERTTPTLALSLAGMYDPSQSQTSHLTLPETSASIRRAASSARFATQSAYLFGIPSLARHRLRSSMGNSAEEDRNQPDQENGTSSNPPLELQTQLHFPDFPPLSPLVPLPTAVAPYIPDEESIRRDPSTS
eukprot:TRINITY_DN19161_c0_g1::TRINITY_DN19161_c0_g1_i1::g.2323::m.2323 TRINITY_DN19161_c0_g1::TRINITY_DN19161_c0_g1_i1::g.2323  ORF type:complete len:238 (+),score=11.70 TRINITY_DN19161_c0_g1_i1:69-782(+)